MILEVHTTWLVPKRDLTMRTRRKFQSFNLLVRIQKLKLLVESRASVKFTSAVHEIINLNRTQTIIHEITKLYQRKAQEIASKKSEKNYIIEKAEEEEEVAHHGKSMKKKSSHF